MMDNEFDIIRKYFTFTERRSDVMIAGGDDCACISVPEQKQLLITTDTLISGVHFPEDTCPEDIAYKAIMVNLSDLAAMGASPAWLTLAITLPAIDEDWLSRFSQTFSDLLTRFEISLVGGDTTRGNLSITIQAMGLCDSGKLLQRNKARVGDKIYVTGTIGDAAIGLQAVINELDDEPLQSCITRLSRPEARVKFAEQLGSYSTCAIDISDGLIADLGHILEASDCGAKVLLPDMPRSSAADYYFERYNDAVTDWAMLLTQGDDYELCFTLSEEVEGAVLQLAEKQGIKISCIGEITENKALIFINSFGETEDISGAGFKHF